MIEWIDNNMGFILAFGFLAILVLQTYINIKLKELIKLIINKDFIKEERLKELKEMKEFKELIKRELK